MVTFSVTIDEESNKDLFLRIMEELNFVVSVKPENNSGTLNALELAVPGKSVSDGELEELMVLAEKEETYIHQRSKKINTQRFSKWLGEANK